MTRIAVVSDIHGNLTALDAVVADLRQVSPDLVFHGGDLADAGSSPVEVVDRLRDLAWQGVLGNTDEMLFDPDSLREFASQNPKLKEMFAVVEEMAAATREALGTERLAWLSALPRVLRHETVALVHASPDTPWRSPRAEATDAELESVYGPLGQPIAVYAHIHRSFIRTVPGLVVANCGSVSLSHDGDTRAAYLLVEDGRPVIRRVEYDLDRELAALSSCGLPHADWTARTLRSGRPEMP